MAEIAYSMNKQRPGAILYEWEGVTQADTFQRLELDLEGRDFLLPLLQQIKEHEAGSWV